MILFDTIFFGGVIMFLALILSAIAGLILAVIVNLVSIILEESVNLVLDIGTLLRSSVG